MPGDKRDKKTRRYRKVQPHMWADEKIRRLTWPQPCGLGLFFYLMTGRETCGLPGALEVTEAGLADRLRWSVEGLREAFEEVSREGLAKADWEAPLVWLPGGPKNNPPESPNVVVSWARNFNELPECALKAEVYRDVGSYVKGLREGYRKAFTEHFEDPSGNQEQEQLTANRSSGSSPRARARDGDDDVSRDTPEPAPSPTRGALNAGPTDAEVARHWNLVAQAAGSAGHPLKHYRDDFAMLAGFARRQLPGQPWRDFLSWWWGEDGWAGKHPHLAKPASLVKSWDQSVREWRDPIAFAASKDRDKPRPLTRQEREDDQVIADIMRAAAAREAGHG